MKKLSDIIFLNIVFPFIGSIIAAVVMVYSVRFWLGAIIVPAVTLFFTILKTKSIDLKSAFKRNIIILATLAIIFFVLMIYTDGNTSSAVMVNASWFAFPFFPLSLISNIMSKTIVVFASVLLTLFVQTFYLLFKNKASVRTYIVLIAAALIISVITGNLYLNRPSVRYAGHGFKYMHGYSSTDLTNYSVYAENSKLATLDHKSSFVIENEIDMPVLDGAEACYPLYSAIAKAIYKDIDEIEKNVLNTDYDIRNGKIVSFTNTVRGFKRLLTKEQDKYYNRVDMFFGAEPSESQLELAKNSKVTLNVTSIGKEAFVFFVEKDNPIENLSSENLRAIYHGDITNWKDLGGKNQEIVAFQRPANSGSQTVMEHFMGDITLKEPKSYEKIDAMMGVIKEVAQYANEKGAIGYSFRYFLEELGQEKGVKMLSVDGVYPTIESIENGNYPLTTDLCLITRSNDFSPNPNIQKMIDFILSEEGQDLVRKTGYAGLK